MPKAPNKNTAHHQTLDTPIRPPSRSAAIVEAATQSAVGKPEFYRLPKRGGDPHFGLTRSWYYAAEQRGLIQLKRLRDRGKLRGVTLVPYDAVRKLITEAGK